MTDKTDKPSQPVRKEDEQLRQYLLVAQLGLKHAAETPTGDRIVRKMAAIALIKVQGMISELEKG